jgi:DNA (cytosine-5)-methyltransferase 1
LFSGIGGIDLAFSLAGFDILFQVEIDEFCQKVLAKHSKEYWPNAKIFTDVRAVGKHNLPTSIDVLFGGFPCQDISVAGNGAGLEGERSGLWWEFARIIGEI